MGATQLEQRDTQQGVWGSRATGAGAGCASSVVWQPAWQSQLRHKWGASVRSNDREGERRETYGCDERTYVGGRYKIGGSRGVRAVYRSMDGRTQKGVAALCRYPVRKERALTLGLALGLWGATHPKKRFRKSRKCEDG